MKTAKKLKRITILGTPEFKDFLVREAKKEGLSLSQLVWQRCERKPQNRDEALLAAFINEVIAATAKAKVSLEKGISDVEKILAEIRGTA